MGSCFLRPADPRYVLRCRQNTQVDKPEEATVVDLQEPVSLSFALRYLNSFAKASPLSSQVLIADQRHQPYHPLQLLHISLHLILWQWRVASLSVA